jgi:hypothetical protein
MFLIGNKFTPQIQFRVKTQIVWAEKPSQMDKTNVGTGSTEVGYPSFGKYEFPPDGEKMQKEFKLWDFETTYFNLTGYLDSGTVVAGTGGGTLKAREGVRDPFGDFLVSGSAYDAVQGAAGWHLLSGESHFQRGGNSILGFTVAEQVCRGSDSSVAWRGGCERAIDYFDDTGKLDWNTFQNGITGSASCFPNQAVDITNTLNTPTHKFPASVLTHELRSWGFGL